MQLDRIASMNCELAWGTDYWLLTKVLRSDRQSVTADEGFREPRKESQRMKLINADTLDLDASPMDFLELHCITKILLLCIYWMPHYTPNPAVTSTLHYISTVYSNVA